ncbi:unnamed protein product [Schistosoma mattheei]|uniref:Neur_chan_LBD domain-containing protein n=2 Tax=Schistosoma mattheei TaxID=31246 RepID=A0AA85B999_9TREM|nr:unnamed protein product [Schistosoma mattheei]
MIMLHNPLIFTFLNQILFSFIFAQHSPNSLINEECNLNKNMTLGNNSLETEIQHLLSTYVRTERPRNLQMIKTNNNSQKSMNYIPYNGPLIVEVNTFIHSFSSISVVNMDFTVDFMLRQRWLDTRLKLSSGYNFTQLPISYAKNQIWIPDLFFRNAKHGFLHDMTTPNYLIWLDSNGLITFSQKISMKLSCHMTLHSFPFDSQHCTINIGSYGYSKSDLEFRWWNTDGYDQFGLIPAANQSRSMAVQIRSGLEINEFDLLSYDTSYCKMEYSTTGRFSCIEAVFHLKRRFGFYLIYAYLPSLLLVVIAWLSFFVDYEAVPARISIGLLCVLALITQSAAILTQVPRVSYIKGIDIWLFVCLAFVVSSLLEFAIANSLARRRSKSGSLNSINHISNDCIVLTTSDELLDFLQKYINKVKNNDDQSDEKTLRNNNDLCKTHKNISSTSTPTKSIIRNFDPLSNKQKKIIFCDGNHQVIKCKHLDKSFLLDRIWSIIYPIVFAIFNGIYWIYFLKYQ